MRKYLWAIVLCGAAGMAVPGWAQERSKSLFGLGRSKPAAGTSAKSDKEKPAKLKNYGELFGRGEGSDTAPNAKAPSPASVQKMMADADGTPAPKITPAKSKSAALESFDRQDAVAENASVIVKPAPVVKVKTSSGPKSSLLDDMDDLDKLEEQEEREEAQEAVAVKAPPKKSAALAMPAAEERVDEKPLPAMPASEGRVVVRPPVKPKAAAKTAAMEKPAPESRSSLAKPSAAEKPAWASSGAEDEEVVAADFKPTPQKKIAPSIKQVRAEDSPAAHPVATASRVAVSKSPVVRKTPSRLNAPINVASSEEMTPAEAADTTPAPATPAPRAARPGAQSRLTVTRGNSRSAAPAPEASALSSASYTPSAEAKAPAVVTQSPTVTVEWRSTGAVNVGQESSCDLIVKNSGSVMAQKVEIEAKFPSNVRLVSANPKPASDSDLVWAFDEIAPGDEKIVQVKFVPVERGEVAAAASVRFTGAASTSFAVTEPLLSVKLEGSSEVMVGENASQTLLISNPGTGTAANVKVEALIPAGLEHARGERLLMELGNLAPGENRPIRLALTAVAGGRQVIEVHATADNGLVQSAASEVTVIAPSLATSIEGPGLRYLGRNATYTLHVSNDGAASTDNVRVMHKIPEGFEFVSAERGAQYDPANRMLNWFVGRLDRGAKSQVAVVLNAKSAGEFTHFIRATSEHGAISDSEVTTRIEGAASLVVDISDLDDPVEVGVETAYEIRVKNAGTAPAKNVALTCELPAGVEFQTANGDSGFATEKELVVFEPVAEVAPGKTLTYRVKVKGTLSGNMRFRTKVSSDSLAEPLASEEMTKIYGE